MILSKKQLKYYLKCDKLAMEITKSRPSLFKDYLCKFQIDYRKHGYYHNCKNIIINKGSKIGKNISISASCRIGTAHNGYSVIGDNVKIWLGSIVIGNIKIADNVTVGAGSVVVKNVMTTGVTVAGSQAKVISSNINYGTMERLNRFTQL